MNKHKTLAWLIFIACWALALLLLNGCKKNEPVLIQPEITYKIYGGSSRPFNEIKFYLNNQECGQFVTAKKGDFFSIYITGDDSVNAILYLQQPTNDVILKQETGYKVLNFNYQL